VQRRMRIAHDIVKKQFAENVLARQHAEAEIDDQRLQLYSIGDIVTKINHSGSNKLALKFIGTYQIIDKFNNGRTYKIIPITAPNVLVMNAKMETANIDQLKLMKPREKRPRKKKRQTKSKDNTDIDSCVATESSVITETNEPYLHPDTMERLPRRMAKRVRPVADTDRRSARPNKGQIVHNPNLVDISLIDHENGRDFANTHKPIDFD